MEYLERTMIDSEMFEDPIKDSNPETRKRKRTIWNTEKFKNLPLNRKQCLQIVTKDKTDNVKNWGAITSIEFNKG